MADTYTEIFKALSDPSRREIFHSLVGISSALSINQITSKFNMTRQGVTKHIKILEKAELITITSKGTKKYCMANPKPLKKIDEWLSFYEKFWDDSLDRLSSYLDE